MVKGVAHKYETVKGVIFYSGGKASTWWKDLQSIREGVGLGFLTGLIIIQLESNQGENLILG